MPFELTLAPPLARMIFSGTLTAADLAGLAAAFRKVDSGGEHFSRRLADLSGVSVMEVRLPDVFALAQERRAIPVATQVRTALLAVTPVQLGIARMFQTLNDHPQIELRVFTDREAAMAWLGEAEQTLDGDGAAPTPKPAAASGGDPAAAS